MYIEIQRSPSAIKMGWLALSFSLVAGVAGASPSRSADAYVEAVMKEWSIPGMAVAVVQNDKVVFARGYGVRQIDRPERVDENTTFGMGSVTKSFTATAAAMLVDDGKLAWDAPILDYIPSLQLKDPWITAHGTVRDLAAHRLGIDGNLAYMVIGGDLDSTVRTARYIYPRSPFGEFLYSNTGYALLGKTIENASGGSWDEFITNRILKPLQMRHSYSSEYAFIDRANLARCWVCAPKPGTPVGVDALKDPHGNVAVPHGVVEEPGGSEVKPGLKLQVLPWREDRTVVSTGMVFSSVSDMAQYVRMHLANGEFQGKRLVSEAQMQQLHSSQALLKDVRLQSSSDTGPKFTAYGMGWMTGTYRGTPVLQHGGGRVGFYTDVWLFPEKKIGVVVLQNLDFQSSTSPDVVSLKFADQYLGLPFSKDVEQRGLHRPKEWKPVSTRHAECQSPASGAAPALVAKLTGQYHSDLIGDVQVVSEGGRLSVVFEPQSIADLVPAAHESFVACFRGYQQSPLPGPPLPLRFSYDGSDKVTGFVLGEGEPGLPLANPYQFIQPNYFKRAL